MSSKQGRCSAISATILVLTLFLSCVTTKATTYVVGGSSGWTFNVESWTSGKKFKAGDILGKYYITCYLSSSSSSSSSLSLFFFFFFFFFFFQWPWQVHLWNQISRSNSLTIFYFVVTVFNYDPSLHNVAVVDAKGYKSCTSTSSSQAYSSGKDKLKLSKGQNYFICSIPGHCDGGVKLSVNAS